MPAGRLPHPKGTSSLKLGARMTGFLSLFGMISGCFLCSSIYIYNDMYLFLLCCMRKWSLYTTLWAIIIGALWAIIIGAFLAYILLQWRYDTSFLLGDILQISLPDNFRWVHYHIDSDRLIVSADKLAANSTVSLTVSYNPDRVIIDTGSIQSSQSIISLSDDTWLLFISLRLISSNQELFVLPFVSDPEYHILVRDASLWDTIDGEPLSIKHL